MGNNRGNKKILCVLTNMFPYGKLEAYMESEIQHYGSFEKVFMFSLMIKPNAAGTRRNVPEYITVIPVFFTSRIIYAFWALSVLGDRNFYRETASLLHKRRFNISRLIRIFVYFSRAHYEANVILKQVRKELEGKDVIFYSYRFEYQPYVAVLLRKKLKLPDAVIVSRAHGYDLYEERNKDKYIPFREGLLRELKYVFPCSAYGKKYLEDRYPSFRDKIATRYLGTTDCGLQDGKKEEGFTIVSCSNVVKLKRLDKIADTLQALRIRQVRWIHFGDGVEMDWLRERVTYLPESVQVDLRGAVSNDTIMQDYKNHYYDVFINLSDSEGLPVSIMEALSFGIPCAATDVGGTAELVKDGINGLLISPEEEPERIAQRISDNVDRFHTFRQNARDSWEGAFDAEINYSSFVSELAGLSVQRE